MRPRSARTWAALGIAVLMTLAVGGVVVGHAVTGRSDSVTSTVRTSPTPIAPPLRPYVAHGVGSATFRVVDPRRTVRSADGATVPRSFAVTVRYPAVGTTRNDVPGAAPAPGRHPLIVFGHGYDISPAPYAPLLRAWARAGYVVAAPIFPLERPDAPGGPDEADLVHQPTDMSLVISRLEAGGPGVPVAVRGVVDTARIAVAGHSDGGDTALAVAEDPRYRDRRVDAAIILSGAEIPFVTPIRFPSSGPPLLAVQGTADVINPLADTLRFWLAAAPPKYLLTLSGQGHLPPYSTATAPLAVVERVSIAFLARYLGHGSEAAITAAGDAPGVARLQAVTAAR
jgi:dienelactone hydrolase